MKDAPKKVINQTRIQWMDALNTASPKDSEFGVRSEARAEYHKFEYNILLCLKIGHNMA